MAFFSQLYLCSVGIKGGKDYDEKSPIKFIVSLELDLSEKKI